MIPMRTRSPSLVWPVSCHASFSGVLPGSLWYNSLFPASPSIPPLPQLAVNADATNHGPRNLPQPHLCYYTNLLMSGLLIAFRPCFLCVRPSHDPTLDSEFMPISSSIPTVPKSCAAAFLSASFVFVTPKVSSLPNDLWFVYPCSPGGVRLILRHGGVGCSSGLYTCFGLFHGPSVRVLTHFVMEQGEGRGLGEFVCVCIVLVLVYN